jgi:YVTN family beta-propeller protein
VPAFVTNERDGTITVIDTGADRVYSTIKVGGRLRGIRLSFDPLTVLPKKRPPREVASSSLRDEWNH